MAFGLQGFTLVHIVISLVAIGAGFLVVGGFLANNRLREATFLFLVLTIATSATGFFFPAGRFLPSHAFSILSLILLAVAMYANYVRDLDGGWRLTYVVTSLVALYLNVFVLIVQTFQKNPALVAIAPTQSEPPFLITQAMVLIAFVLLGVMSVSRFHPK